MTNPPPHGPLAGSPDATQTTSAAPAHRVRCPACGGAAVFDRSNPFRPFCSGRCRELDLGAWASERFRVPGEPDPTAPGADPSEA
jgi:uncharacterized protein